MQSSSTPDPYYRSEPAQWVMRRVVGTGIAVDIVEGLEMPVLSNREKRHIWVRAGMSFHAFHWSMACGIVHQLFGIEPPTAAPVPDPEMSCFAQVIPFQRPPFSSGKWR